MSAVPTATPPTRVGGILTNLLSSVVVFLVALPLCMGIAIASGVPPAAGLVTGIVGGIIVGMVAGSPLLVSGPAAGLAVLVFELVQEHGIAALGPVVLISGLIQIAAGIGRVGVWFRMVSPAVINGMLAGIGILIVASQLHVMLDAAPLSRGLQNFAAFPERLWSTFMGGNGVEAGIIGVGVIAVMVLWEKFKPKPLRFVPGALIAIVLATLAAQLGGLDVKRVTLPENLAAALNWVGPSDLPMLLDPSIWIAALVFAFIASAETLLSAAAVDRMHDGVRTKYDRELMAQGLGNTLCGLVGALPMTGVIVRSAANVQAGATSRLSTVLHGSWILAFVVLLPWLLRMAPVAGLAGILVYTGVKMVNIKQLKELAHFGRGTVAVFVATTVAIVATDLLVGVAVGVALSLLRLALRAASLHLAVKRVDPGVVNVRMVGAATFLNLPRIARVLEALPDNTKVVADVERLRFIDHACLTLLRDWSRTAPARGCSLQVDWALLESRTEASGRKAAAQAVI